MKIYEILDKESHLSIGVLQYYEKEQTYIIELQDNLDEWTAPLLFTNYVKRGIFTIPRQESYLWVKERVIPSGRQNIGSILSNHNLTQYNEIKLLEISKGLCSQDSLIIKKTDTLPDYVTARKEKNLLDCCTCEDNKILCFFADNKVNKISLDLLKDVSGVDKILGNRKLFESGKVGIDGYYITFNDSIDIPAHVLYETKSNEAITSDDFMAYAQKNVLDTGQVCDILECTRQNLAYLTGKGIIKPIQKDVKGNLYIKGDILRSAL